MCIENKKATSHTYKALLPCTSQSQKLAWSLGFVGQWTESVMIYKYPQKFSNWWWSSWNQHDHPVAPKPRQRGISPACGISTRHQLNNVASLEHHRGVSIQQATVSSRGEKISYTLVSEKDRRTLGTRQECGHTMWLPHKGQ